MKNLLIGLLMLVTTNVMANFDKSDLRLKESRPIIVSEIKCVEGYQYLYTTLNNTIAVTQMMESSPRLGEAANPIRCNVE